MIFKQKLIYFVVTFLTIVTVTSCDNSRSGLGTDGGVDEVIDEPVGDGSEEGQIELGQLKTYNIEQVDDNSLRGISIISIYSLVPMGKNSSFSSLKMCNKTHCWTLFDNLSTNERKVEEVINSREVLQKGRFIMEEIGVSVDSLHYIYQGQAGVISLKDKISFADSMFQRIYLEEIDPLELILSSVSIPFQNNALFLPHQETEREFEGGLILHVPQESINLPALVNTEELKSTKTEKTSLFPVKSYQVSLFRIKESTEQAKDMINSFPTTFAKNIQVFLPVVALDETGEIDKELYTLVIDGEEIDFELISKNNKEYIQFETNKTKFTALFIEKHSGLGWEK